MKKVIIFFSLVILAAAVIVLPKTNFNKKQEVKITPPSKIVVAYSFVKANQMPIIVAQEKGLFKKYNLNVKIKQVDKNVTTVITSGKADAMIGTPNVALAPAVQGAKLSWIGTINNDSTVVMVADKDNKDIKTIGVMSGPNKIQAMGLLALIGIDPKNLTFQELSDNKAKLIAFEQKKVDSVYVQKPDWIIFKNKAKLSDENKVILDSSKNKKAQTPIAIIVRDEYLKNNKQTVTNFSKALIEANYWIKNNKEAFTKFVEANFSDMPKEDAKIQAEVFYDTVLGLEFTPTMEKGKEMLDLVTAANPKAKDYNLKNFVSTDISDSLKKEGFLNKFKFN